MLGTFVKTSDWFNGRRMCQVEEGLFLGSYGDACYKDRLKSSNVTHILTVANLAPAFPGDFVYKVVDVTDTEETHIGQHFEECINFIDEARRQGGSILVPLFMGSFQKCDGGHSLSHEAARNALVSSSGTHKDQEASGSS